MSAPVDPFRGYLRTLTVAFAAPLALLVLFTMALDPFGVWRNLGLSPGKRPTVTWSRIAAAERLRADCDIALVGSSRIVFGYGTKMPKFGRLKPCNGALGGTSIRELDEVFDLIVDETDIKAIILFVDLHMFHDGRGFNHDFAQSLLNDDRTAVTYYAWSLTSLSTIEYATKSLGWQLPFFEAPKPERPPVMENRAMLRMTMLNDSMYRRFLGPDETYDIFRSMLDKARRHRIRVMVVIPAAHAMELEAEYTSGLWEINRAWRRFLVEETSKRDVPLWDFATYHSPAVAPVPLTLKDPPTPWWSDVNHQSQLLGKLTLERIADAMLDKEGDWEPRFGVKLTPENIEQHLADLDAGRVAWREEHPDQAAWFDGIIAEMKEDDPGVAEDWDVNRRRGLGENVTWGENAQAVREEGLDF